MEQDYTWEQQEGYEEPPRDGFGWYVLVAVVIALVFHLALLIWGVNKVLTFEFTKAEEWVSEPMNLQQIEVSPEDIAEAAPTAEEQQPDEGSELLEEIEDILPEMKNVEIDISADIVEPELPNMKLETPALSGDEEGVAIEPVKGPEVNPETMELGQVDNLFPEVKSGQLIVDQGKPIADVLDPNSLAKEMERKKGAGGVSDQGVLSGYTGLEAYSKMAPGDLQKNKASIGSDLLFGFNETNLKSDARNTLMTVGMLVERNPDMYCWVEGHTDLIGADIYNLELSQKRADAVKDWLVRSLRINPARIVVRAYGKTDPLVMEGDAVAQAPNRRVDIKMRKTLPTEAPVRVLVKPGEAPVVVDPKRPMPEMIPKAIPAPEEEPEAPRAVPIPEDDEPAPRAIPIEDDAAPKAIPIEEDPNPSRAQVVPE